LETLIKAIDERFPGAVGVVSLEGDMPTLRVEAPRLRELCAWLASEAPTTWEQLTDITARDERPATPRFTLVYHLLSLSANRRLRLEVGVEEGEPQVDSVTPVWPGADWVERETWDMFGIRFAGHPDLRRILMPEGYNLHPLRKDAPTWGVDPGRHYREWDEGREDQGE
jgi:NADH:ubiquinone oxidoreductase subunit C